MISGIAFSYLIYSAQNGLLFSDIGSSFILLSIILILDSFYSLMILLQSSENMNKTSDIIKFDSIKKSLFFGNWKNGLLKSELIV